MYMHMATRQAGEQLLQGEELLGQLATGNRPTDTQAIHKSETETDNEGDQQAAAVSSTHKITLRDHRKNRGGKYVGVKITT
ncbi:hypothetical protein Y1Q_0019009 [Alligator mississippiensis]|uniref:Uncharacterized protein n=1 Tax=Alligator mississippiensis TaxID=8496 RepID=A0A151M3I1_ALLMI|nr:hypothetical protein Y1Q_0019009 [Alligator mississippiensis]